jgi:hypothetical protein
VNNVDREQHDSKKSYQKRKKKGEYIPRLVQQSANKFLECINPVPKCLFAFC